MSVEEILECCVGAPFKPCGNDLNGMDCVGLICHVGKQFNWISRDTSAPLCEVKRTIHDFSKNNMVEMERYLKQHTTRVHPGNKLSVSTIRPLIGMTVEGHIVILYQGYIYHVDTKLGCVKCPQQDIFLVEVFDAKTGTME